MWRIIKARIQQGYRTLKFPGEEPVLPDRYRGRPVIDPSRISGDPLRKEYDPTGALSAQGIDLGRSLFNEDAKKACPDGALAYSKDYRMAVSKREHLQLTGKEFQLASALQERSKRIFGRSLKLREVCAGGCNGCDAEIQVLSIVVFDLSRFGIDFVASPRHADGLIVTGPVTKNMETALKKTYDALADPKIVIAVGACAINGGPFYNGREVRNGVDQLIPVDLYVPGCPPHPLTILDGLLRLLDKIEKK